MSGARGICPKSIGLCPKTRGNKSGNGDIRDYNEDAGSRHIVMYFTPPEILLSTDQSNEEKGERAPVSEAVRLELEALTAELAEQKERENRKAHSSDHAGSEELPPTNRSPR